MFENWRKHYLSSTEKISPRRLVRISYNSTLKDSVNFSGPNYPSFHPVSTLYGWTLQAATRSYVKLTIYCLRSEGVDILSSDPLGAIGVPGWASTVRFSNNLPGLLFTVYSSRQSLYLVYVSDQTTVQRKEFTASFSSVGIDDSKYSLWGREREFIIILRDLTFLFK